MNVTGTDRALVLAAKTCSSMHGKRKIIYSVADYGHVFCIDKKEIIMNQLEACKRLLPYASETDRVLVEKEIAELEMALDLMP